MQRHLRLSLSDTSERGDAAVSLEVLSLQVLTGPLDGDPEQNCVAFRLRAGSTIAALPGHTRGVLYERAAGAGLIRAFSGRDREVVFAPRRGATDASSILVPLVLATLSAPEAEVAYGSFETAWEGPFERQITGLNVGHSQREISFSLGVNGTFVGKALTNFQAALASQRQCVVDAHAHIVTVSLDNGHGAIPPRIRDGLVERMIRAVEAEMQPGQACMVRPYLSPQARL